MQKKVNLADTEKARELLEMLYADKTSKNAQESIISENHSEGTTREKRSDVAYRMGLQPAFNKGCDNSHTK